MKKLTFILGGLRSGKSKYAVELAKRLNKKTAFIATCIFFDKELEERIKLHRRSRPKNWKIVEEGKEIISILEKLKDKYETILIDCLGMWISNLLIENLKDKKIEKEIKDLAKFISKLKNEVILVSNEVGEGIISENLLARRFQNLIGFANQLMAKISDRVIYLKSGIPIRIKDEEIK